MSGKEIIPISSADAILFIGQTRYNANICANLLLTLLKNIKITPEIRESQDKIFNYLKNIISRPRLTCSIYQMNNHQLNISLPDGDIRVGICVPIRRVHEIFRSLINTLNLRSQTTKPAHILKTVAAATNSKHVVQQIQDMEDQKITKTPPKTPSSFSVSSVTVIDAFNHRLFCYINRFSVTLVTNTSIPLARHSLSYAFDSHSSKNHLFYDTLNLLRIWGFKESRILCLDEQTKGLKNSSLEVMLMMIINCYLEPLFHLVYNVNTGISAQNSPTLDSSIWKPIPLTPLTVLFVFFQTYYNFNYRDYVITPCGPISCQQYEQIITNNTKQVSIDSCIYSQIQIPYPTPKSPCVKAVVPSPILQNIMNSFGVGSNLDSSINSHSDETLGHTINSFGNIEHSDDDFNSDILVLSNLNTCFSYGPINIVDSVNFGVNTATSINDEDLYAIKRCFNSALQTIVTGISKKDQSMNTLEHLFPNFTSENNDLIDSVKDSISKQVDKYQQKEKKEVQLKFAHLKKQLQVVKKIINEHSKDNIKPQYNRATKNDKTFVIDIDNKDQSEL